MSALITFHQNTPVVSHRTIAEYTKVQAINIAELIQAHHNDFEEFGAISVLNRDSDREGNGGRPSKEYLLNEPQATLLMTYLKNTPIVREFKKTLVRAFFELRNQPTQQFCIPVGNNKTITISKSPSGGFIVGDGSVNSLLNVSVLKFLELKLGTKAVKVLLRAMIPVLNTPEALEDEVQDYKDTLSGFIECYVVIDQNARTKSRDVYEAYLKWCITTNTEPLKMPMFTAEFKKHKLGEHKSYSFDTGITKGFSGFTIAPFGGAL